MHVLVAGRGFQVLLVVRRVEREGRRRIFDKEGEELQRTNTSTGPRRQVSKAMARFSMSNVDKLPTEHLAAALKGIRYRENVSLGSLSSHAVQQLLTNPAATET